MNALIVNMRQEGIGIKTNDNNHISNIQFYILQFDVGYGLLFIHPAIKGINKSGIIYIQQHSN